LTKEALMINFESYRLTSVSEDMFDSVMDELGYNESFNVVAKNKMFIHTINPPSLPFMDKLNMLDYSITVKYLFELYYTTSMIEDEVIDHLDIINNNLPYIVSNERITEYIHEYIVDIECTMLSYIQQLFISNIRNMDIFMGWRSEPSQQVASVDYTFYLYQHM
jgi:hypothetical protein